MEDTNKSKSLYPVRCDRFLDDVLIPNTDMTGKEITKSFTDSETAYRFQHMMKIDGDQRKDLNNVLLTVYCRMYEIINDEQRYFLTDMLAQFLKSCGDTFDVIGDKETESEINGKNTDCSSDDRQQDQIPLEDSVEVSPERD